MKLFVDTANLEELEQCLKRGFPSGVTTNPSILSKEQRRDFRLHINDMIALLQKHERDIPLSVEVFTTDPAEMIAQAEQFVGHFGHYPNLYVKVPVGWNELAVIHQLRRRGIKVNCTCCMSYNQAVMAAQAGADILTVPPKVFPQMCGHPKTDEAVRQFVSEFQKWQTEAPRLRKSA